MSTLLLRLAGPLQAWGIDSKFETRKTCAEPTKSGVVGLLAAALGRRRDEAVNDLTALRFGVRVDQAGKLLRDFHTARRADGVSYVTSRQYLSDAAFLVGLESKDEHLLCELAQALSSPAYPLFLGRRSCPPVLPLCLGIRQSELQSALADEPWLVQPWRQSKLDPHLRVITEGEAGETNGQLQRNVPLSFNPVHRQYGYGLMVRRTEVNKSTGNQTDHDAMAELGG